MKRKTFLLFFVCLFLGSNAIAQSPDLPLFEEEKTPEPCPTCAKKKVPNIGNDAKPVESVYFAPPPIPPLKVGPSTEKLSPKPFEGVDMAYEGRYVDTTEYTDKLSKPVDFSATQVVKKAPDVQIKKDEEVTKENEKKDKVVPEKDASQKQEDKATLKEDGSIGDAFQEFVPLKQSVGKSSDASAFDIAGLQLGMSPDDVVSNAIEKGFEITNVAYGIPSFMVTNFERDCRESGLYQLRLIHECVRERARNEDVYYISQLVFKSAETNEQIVVLFSSSLTNNQAFKIDYTGFGDNSLGTSYKDLLKKTNRRDVFWKYVYDKYGRPKGSGNAPYWGNPKGVLMRAFLEGNAMNGRIVLEDVTQKGNDYRQAESQNKEQEVPNPFNF